MRSGLSQALREDVRDLITEEVREGCPIILAPCAPLRFDNRRFFLAATRDLRASGLSQGSSSNKLELIAETILVVESMTANDIVHSCVSLKVNFAPRYEELEAWTETPRGMIETASFGR